MADVPLYYMLGQNAFRGDISDAFLTNNRDDAIDDAEASIDVYDYDGATATTYDTTPGSAKSNTQDPVDAGTVALDVTLFRHLKDVVHPANNVAIVKRTDQGALGGTVVSSRWLKSYGELYGNFSAANSAITGAISGRNDTAVVKGFFLSFGYEEAVLADSGTDATLKADLAQMIRDLRADYGTDTTPVVLDFPPATVAGFSASQLASLANARKVIHEVASEDAFVSYVNNDDLPRANSTAWFYTGESMLIAGKRLAEEMERLVVGKGTVPGGGAPVYVLLGDESAVGQVPSTFLTAGDDDDYNGPIANAKTWNWATNQWETLDGTLNSNTSTDGASNFGPEVAMAVRLLASKHAGQTVYVFKLGRNASSLGNPAATGGSWAKSDADIYTELAAEWGLAKSAMLSVDGVVPDVRGVVWIQGQEDVATDALAQGYLTRLKTLVDDYRDLFATRTDGERLPFVVARLQEGTGLDTANVDTLRLAQRQAWLEDTSLLLVDLGQLRLRADNRNLTGDALLEAGGAIAEVLA